MTVVGRGVEGLNQEEWCGHRVENDLGDSSEIESTRGGETEYRGK